MGAGIKCTALTLNQSWKVSSNGSLSPVPPGCFDIAKVNTLFCIQIQHMTYVFLSVRVVNVFPFIFVF